MKFEKLTQGKLNATYAWYLSITISYFLNSTTMVYLVHHMNGLNVT